MNKSRPFHIVPILRRLLLTVLVLSTVTYAGGVLPSHHRHIQGSAAVVDHETGRIFWESSRGSTLQVATTSMFGSVLGPVRTVLLSVLVWAVAVRFGWVRLLTRLYENGWNKGQIDTIRPWLLVFTTPVQAPWFSVAIVLLYLAEAAVCETRRFLSHRLIGAEAVDARLQLLRSSRPEVQWKLRLSGVVDSDDGTVATDQGDTHTASNGTETKARQHKRRVSSQFHSTNYTYGSWTDATVYTTENEKMTLPSNSVRKSPSLVPMLVRTVLVLADAPSREDYVRQQREFFKRHVGNARAEFATRIRLDGHQPRLCAVLAGSSWLTHPAVFWICTAMGLTLPYRLWFDQQCKQRVQVTVVKKTSVKEAPSGWFGTSKQNLSTDEMTDFRSLLDIGIQPPAQPPATRQQSKINKA